MNYSQLKKLDEETSHNLKEGSGPTDDCLCSLLAPEDDSPRKGFRASIRKAIGSISGSVKKQRISDGGLHRQSVDIPLVFSKGAKGIYTTKEAVKRTSPCGQCGCDNENIILKHSYANIRISTPDISSFCSCPNDCLISSDKLSNNIKVTIEQVAVRDMDNGESEFSVYSSNTDSLDTVPDPDISSYIDYLPNDSITSTPSMESVKTVKSKIEES